MVIPDAHPHHAATSSSRPVGATDTRARAPDSPHRGDTAVSRLDDPDGRVGGDRASPVSPAAWPILIVTAHQLVGWSLTYSLRAEGLAARFQPLDAARAVLESAGPVSAGIVLLDLDLPLGRDDDGDPVDGVALVAPLRAAGWQVLVLTGTAGRSRLGAALSAGAIGWVPKNASFPALLTALREARAGRTTTSATRRRELIALHHRDERGHHQLLARLDTLTARERDVLARLAAGHPAPAIAEESAVSLHTVRTQVRAVLVKLGVSSQLEAVAAYSRAHGR